MGPAALPIAMIASGGLSAAGGILGAKAAQPKAVSIPAPAPLFPGIQQGYMDALTQSGITGTSFGTLAETARTGLPTDVGPAFEALKTSMGHGISEGRTNLIEQFGVKGLRYGSDVSKAGADFESQTQKDFASILADFTRQASEAAANRRVAAAVQGQGAAGELATAFRPTAVVAGGGASPTGAGLQSAGGSLQNFIMMKALFPDLFGGGGGASGGDMSMGAGY